MTDQSMDHRRVFIVGFNTPGYLPECEPFPFPRFEDAIGGMISWMESHRDETDIPTDAAEYDRIIELLKIQKTQGDIGITIANTHYFLTFDYWTDDQIRDADCYVWDYWTKASIENGEPSEKSTIPDDATEVTIDDPEILLEYIDQNYSMADDNEKCTLFTLAEALYWFCIWNHEGQDSTLYSVQSRLDYSPGMGDTGPEEDARYIYNTLARAAGVSLYCDNHLTSVDDDGYCNHCGSQEPIGE